MGSEMCIRDSLWGDGRHILFVPVEPPTDPATPAADSLDARAEAHLRRLILEVWPVERLSQLLEYCTGLKVLPAAEHAHSLSKQPITVKISGSEQGQVPTASTCVRELYMPDYLCACDETMRARLEYAFDNMDSSGFQYE